MNITAPSIQSIFRSLASTWPRIDLAAHVEAFQGAPIMEGETVPILGLIGNRIQARLLPIIPHPNKATTTRPTFARRCLIPALIDDQVPVMERFHSGFEMLAAVYVVDAHNNPVACFLWPDADGQPIQIDASVWRDWLDPQRDCRQFLYPGNVPILTRSTTAGRCDGTPPGGRRAA